MENPTTSSSLTEKPKSPEKTRKPGRPPKRKNEEEEVQKKKEKKSKKSDNNVTVRKKRRKITEVLQEEAREQVFRGSKDPDRFFIQVICLGNFCRKRGRRGVYFCGLFSAKVWKVDNKTLYHQQ